MATSDEEDEYVPGSEDSSEDSEDSERFSTDAICKQLKNNDGFLDGVEWIESKPNGRQNGGREEVKIIISVDGEAEVNYSEVETMMNDGESGAPIVMEEPHKEIQKEVTSPTKTVCEEAGNIINEIEAVLNEGENGELIMMEQVEVCYYADDQNDFEKAGGSEGSASISAVEVDDDNECRKVTAQEE